LPAHTFWKEWAVLSPRALAYYARAYLDFLWDTWDTLAGAQSNEEFTFYFLGQLYQVFYIHKGSPFSPAQTNLLRQVVEHSGEKAATSGSFAYYGEDIRHQVEQVLSEMKANEH
jgi:hypothetical protein